MELTAAEKQKVAKATQSHAASTFFAVLTTLVVCLEAARHWGSYGWFNKFAAVALALNLLVGLRELARKKETLALEPFVMVSYLCLMLTAILLGH